MHNKTMNQRAEQKCTNRSSMKWSFRNHQQVAGENSNLRRSWFGALALIAATSTLPLSAQANQEASIADTWYTLSVDDESTVCGAYADFTNGMRIAFAKIGQDWMFSLTNSAWNLTQGAEY